MNFFEHQDQARQNTQKLVGLFALSIVIIILSIYIVVLFLLKLAPRVWWHSELFIIITSVTVTGIIIASLAKIIELRAGGRVIAEQLGGKLLLSEMAHGQERQLLNIVEEMSIAAGIPVPQVYILDREYSINAFAAGFTPNDAVIGVTCGCLQHLNRDELQGVIGHEFSHILNGDMRLNLRLIGLINGILFIYMTGRVMLEYGGGTDGDEDNIVGAFTLFGLALMAIGGIGFVCGRLIKAAISRQREFLADASAVQFTRNPDGIGGVLKKLYQVDSRLSSPYAEEASHMFFGNALKFSWTQMFDTHPPLEERIHRLKGVRFSKLSRTSSSSDNDSLVMSFSSSESENTNIKVNPEEIVSQVGTVTPDHFAHAQELLAQLPESLRLGVREYYSAIAIVYALTLNTQKPELREKQIAWLRQVQPTDMVDRILTFNQEISQINATFRLPLLDLTIPALRQNSAQECQNVYKCIQGLVKVSKYFSLWEWIIQLVVWHRLQPYINPELNPKVQFTAIEEIWSDCILLISAIARIGQTKTEDITYAFRAGVMRLPQPNNVEKPTEPMNCNLTEVKKSIERLRCASPKIKQKVVDACAYTVLLDHQTTPNEADLLRTVAIMLDCPIPPFLNIYRDAAWRK